MTAEADTEMSLSTVSDSQSQLQVPLKNVNSITSHLDATPHFTSGAATSVLQIIDHGPVKLPSMETVSKPHKVTLSSIDRASSPLIIPESDASTVSPDIMEEFELSRSDFVHTQKFHEYYRNLKERASRNQKQEKSIQASDKSKRELPSSMRGSNSPDKCSATVSISPPRFPLQACITSKEVRPLHMPGVKRGSGHPTANHRRKKGKFNDFASSDEENRSELGRRPLPCDQNVNATVRGACVCTHDRDPCIKDRTQNDVAKDVVTLSDAQECSGSNKSPLSPVPNGHANVVGNVSVVSQDMDIPTISAPSSSLVGAADPTSTTSSFSQYSSQPEAPQSYRTDQLVPLAHPLRDFSLNGTSIMKPDIAFSPIDNASRTSEALASNEVLDSEASTLPISSPLQVELLTQDNAVDSETHKSVNPYHGSSGSATLQSFLTCAETAKNGKGREKVPGRSIAGSKQQTKSCNSSLDTSCAQQCLEKGTQVKAISSNATLPPKWQSSPSLIFADSVRHMQYGQPEEISAVNAVSALRPMDGQASAKSSIACAMSKNARQNAPMARKLSVSTLDTGKRHPVTVSAEGDSTQGARHAASPIMSLSLDDPKRQKRSTSALLKETREIKASLTPDAKSTRKTAKDDSGQATERTGTTFEALTSSDKRATISPGNNYVSDMFPTNCRPVITNRSVPCSSCISGAAENEILAWSQGQNQRISATSQSAPNHISPTRRVYARVQDFYYPGVVTSVDMHELHITFDDTSFASYSLSNLEKKIIRCQLFEGDTVVRARDANGVKKGAAKYTIIALLRKEGEAHQKDAHPILASDDVVVVRPVSRSSQGNITTSRRKEGDEKWLVEATVIVTSRSKLENRTLTPEEYRAYTRKDLSRNNISVDSPNIKKRTPATNPAFPIESAVFSGFGIIVTSTGIGLTEDIGKQIVRNGGTVIKEFSEIFDSFDNRTSSQTDTSIQFRSDSAYSKLNTIVLLAQSASTTPKYLNALALGVPCVSIAWMQDCLSEGRLTDWQPYCREYRLAHI